MKFVLLEILLGFNIGFVVLLCEWVDVLVLVVGIEGFKIILDKEMFFS